MVEESDTWLSRVILPACSAYLPFHGYVTTTLALIFVPVNLLFIRVLLSARNRTANNLLLAFAAATDVAILIPYCIFALHLSAINGRESSMTWAKFNLFTQHIAITANSIGHYMMALLAVLRVSVVLRMDREHLAPTLKSVTIAAGVTAMINVAVAVPIYVGVHVKPYPNPEYNVTNNVTNQTAVPATLYNVGIEASLMKAAYYITGVVFKLAPCTVVLLATPILIKQIITANRMSKSVRSYTGMAGRSHTDSNLESRGRKFARRMTSQLLLLARTPGQSQNKLDRYADGVEMNVIQNENCAVGPETENGISNGTSLLPVPGNLTPSSPAPKAPPRFHPGPNRAMLLCLIMVVFLATQLPVAILAFSSPWSLSLQKLYHNCGRMLDILSVINGGVCFFLYCYINSQFRRAVWDLITSWRNATGIGVEHSILRSLRSEHATVTRLSRRGQRRRLKLPAIFHKRSDLTEYMC